VRNLLLFSRKSQSTKSPASLNAILENSVRLVQHQADLQGTTVIVELEPDLPDVICDAAEIQQAVIAVVMNGLEAMPEGGTLTVRSRNRDTRTARIEIEDTGVGIPEEMRGRIFEPFFSTKPRGKGTGLGLAVMYGIVQRHQGEVSYDSRVGHGTVFRIDLPFVPDPGILSPDLPGATREGALP
jgi:signal transduction histidine kinase